MSHIINHYGGEVSIKKRNLKGVVAWDIFFLLDGKRFNGYGSIIDIAENKNPDEIKSELLNYNSYDFFNYWEHDFNTKKLMLRTENIDRLKKYLNYGN